MVYTLVETERVSLLSAKFLGTKLNIRFCRIDRNISNTCVIFSVCRGCDVKHVSDYFLPPTPARREGEDFRFRCLADCGDGLGIMQQSMQLHKTQTKRPGPAS